MSTYIVRYVDNETGEHIREWEGYATDKSDAFDRAWDDDYYFGKLLGVYEQ